MAKTPVEYIVNEWLDSSEDYKQNNSGIDDEGNTYQRVKKGLSVMFFIQ